MVPTSKIIVFLCVREDLRQVGGHLPDLSQACIAQALPPKEMFVSEANNEGLPAGYETFWIVI